MLEPRIQQHFIDSADVLYQAAQTLAQPIDAAAQALLASLTSGGKVLSLGWGMAAPLACDLTRALVHGFERERPGLAALDVLLDAQHAPPSGADAALARHIHALGMAGDVLVVWHAEAGDVPALTAAVQAAHGRDMSVVAVTGLRADALARALRETDVHVRVPHERALRVREVQQLVLHCVCDAMDAQLMGEQESM